MSDKTKQNAAMNTLSIKDKITVYYAESVLSVFGADEIWMVETKYKSFRSRREKKTRHRRAIETDEEDTVSNRSLNHWTYIICQ